ncbi:MAG: hypothetical protein O7J95_16845 [Planctomycetota bacterium]|nr:hypothetical protein [Planctomycetota bacterium]
MVSFRRFLIVLVVLLLVGSLEMNRLRAVPFLRGDTDASGMLNLTDAVRTFGFLFLGEVQSLDCEDAADTDDNGTINITDGIFSLNFLFLGGGPPPAPFEACGQDPTPDPLDCASFPRCPSGGGSVRVLASKLNFLTAIFPTTLQADLAARPAAVRPLGRPAGEDSRENLLVYESRSGAILSAAIRRKCPPNARCPSPVRLHYTRRGLGEELAAVGIADTDPALSFSVACEPAAQGVDPIPLRGEDFQGWFLAFESVSGSVIAFREDPEYRPQPGVPQDADLDAPEFANFGRGNGLIAVVVIDGIDVMRALQQRRVRFTRLVEIENGKIVCLLTPDARAVHLLELHLVLADLDYDLREPGADVRTIEVPRGTIRLVPGRQGSQPFLPDGVIQRQIAGGARLALDSFQPLFVPPEPDDFCETDTLPDGGKVMVFEGASSSLFFVAEDPGTGRGSVEAFVPARALAGLLDRRPPFVLCEAVYDRGCRPVVLFEATSGTLFSVDPFDQASPDHLRIVAGPDDFAARPAPGGPVDPPRAPPILVASRNSVPGGRVYFDGGRDQLLHVCFATGAVTVLLDRPEIEAVTGEPRADFTWVESLDPGAEPFTLRVLDSESTALLEIRPASGPACRG